MTATLVSKKRKLNRVLRKFNSYGKRSNDLCKKPSFLYFCRGRKLVDNIHTVLPYDYFVN